MLDSGRVDGKRLVSEDSYRLLLKPQSLVSASEFYSRAQVAATATRSRVCRGLKSRSLDSLRSVGTTRCRPERSEGPALFRRYRSGNGFCGAEGFLSIFIASSIATFSSRSRPFASSAGEFFTHTSGGTPKFSRSKP